jgi:hypothetical protein
LLGFAGCGDASLDRPEETAAVGAGFDGAEGLAEGAIVGRKVELTVETVEEPVAEACGADGPDLVAGAEREADAGLTVLGGEGSGRGGAVEEELEFAGLVGGGRVLWHRRFQE